MGSSDSRYSKYLLDELKLTIIPSDPDADENIQKVLDSVNSYLKVLSFASHAEKVIQNIPDLSIECTKALSYALIIGKVSNYLLTALGIIANLISKQTDSIDLLRDELKLEINSQIYQSKLTSLKSQIIALQSNIQEMQNIKNKRAIETNAILARQTCHTILNEFDEDANLFKMAMLSSRVLLPFASMCAIVIKMNSDLQSTTEDLCGMLKAQLLSLVEDYKEQTLRIRLNSVYLEQILSIAIYGSPPNVTRYRFSDPEFEKHIEQLKKEEENRKIEDGRNVLLKNRGFCSITLSVNDKWLNRWTDRLTITQVYEYRAKLIQFYEDDFDKTIELVRNNLQSISNSNRFKKPERKFLESLKE